MLVDKNDKLQRWDLVTIENVDFKVHILFFLWYSIQSWDLLKYNNIIDKNDNYLFFQSLLSINKYIIIIL